MMILMMTQRSVLIDTDWNDEKKNMDFKEEREENRSLQEYFDDITER
jgi:hypothetical protein